MSEQHDLIAAVLGDAQPVGDDHPAAVETYEAVRAALEARVNGLVGEVAELNTLSETISGFEIGVIKPGDTVLLSTPEPIPPELIDGLKRKLTEELPGIKPVILNGLRVEAIYRGDDDG